MPTRCRLPLLAVAGCLAACAEDGGGEPSVARVTYHDDVAPILAKHCTGCHVEGGLAPFVTDDYATVVQWVDAIVVSTHARTMPPFSADNSGTCNTFVGARWLADDELATLAQWVEDGTPEGEPPQMPPVPPVPEVLVGPGIIELHTPEYIPVPEPELGGPADDYQCFRLAPVLEGDRYVVGFEVAPGNPALVHHVLGFLVDPAVFENDATMQALDDASPDRPGWDCRGAAGEDVLPRAVPIGWAPGTGAIEFPAGTGIPLHPGDVIVTQVHYNVAQGSGSDRTAIRMKLAETVAEPAVQALTDPFLETGFGPAPVTLPAGAASTTWSWERPIGNIVEVAADRDVVIWGFAPHMHQRGRKMHLTIERDGGTQCLGEVDRFDFAWQTLYFLEQPIHAKASDRVSVTCEWDTRADTEPVLPGFTTAAEMCTLALYVVPK